MEVGVGVAMGAIFELAGGGSFFLFLWRTTFIAISVAEAFFMSLGAYSTSLNSAILLSRSRCLTFSHCRGK